jgi:hypothetical protein
MADYAKADFGRGYLCSLSVSGDTQYTHRPASEISSDASRMHVENSEREPSRCRLAQPFGDTRGATRQPTLIGDKISQATHMAGGACYEWCARARAEVSHAPAGMPTYPNPEIVLWLRDGSSACESVSLEAGRQHDDAVE